MNPKARQRAELIFQVRSGQMTASQAAKTLGISRQAYYQSGRPKSPIDPEKQKLNDRVKQLEQQVLQYEQRDQLRQILSHWTEREDLPPSKKNPK